VQLQSGLQRQNVLHLWHKQNILWCKPFGRKKIERLATQRQRTSWRRSFHPVFKLFKIQLLLLQMKQTHAIMKTLAPKTAQDPFTSLLGGSDSGSGGSTAGSLNVKGYAARELYLRHLEEDAKVVEVIRKNARQELGISPDREEPSLLRSYLEQRIAVSDHKTMGQVGYMMAWGWELAANTGNEQMLAG